jgi:anti-sigma regulatory factor (Ser/Thr protein kinase)
MLDAREAFSGERHIEVQSSLPQWTRLHIHPLNELREKITNYVRTQLCDLPGDLCEQLALAADELLGNSIEHGCGLDPKCYIDFTCVRTKRMLLFHVKDAGPGFSMNGLNHAAVNNPPEEPLKHTQYRNDKGMRPGGFGIMLVKKIADELIYSEQGNEVILVKYLD